MSRGGYLQAGSGIVRKRELLLAAGATGLGLVLAELACRFLLPPPGFVPFGPHSDGLVTPHPTRDYAYTPGLERDVSLGGRTIRIRFNELGLREPPIALADSSERRILALGDSYTTGFGVEAEEAWPKRLQAELRARGVGGPAVRVINAGISGYSVRQMRMLGEELVPILHPEAVVIGVYLLGLDRVANPFVYFNGGIARRNALPQLAPAKGGALVAGFRRPALRRIELWLDQHLWFAADLVLFARSLVDRPSTPPTQMTNERAQRLAAPSIDDLQRLSTVLSAAHVPLVVLLVVEQADGGRFAATADAFAAVLEGVARRDSGFKVVNPLPALRLAAQGKPIFRLPGDAHWNAAAHGIAALELTPMISSLLAARGPSARGRGVGAATTSPRRRSSRPHPCHSQLLDPPSPPPSPHPGESGSDPCSGSPGPR